MKLYLLRHGIADWPDWDRPDDERPLTKEGKTEMRQMAKFMRGLKPKPSVILSSPFPRAWQTAEIAAEFLKLKLREERDLQKGFNVAKLRKILGRHTKENPMIVGHNPGFVDVIRALTGANVKLAKGGLARVDLEEEEEEGRLVWLLPPKVTR